MAANKRTDTQREADLLEIEKLDRRGWQQHEIAARLGISRQQVSYDLKQIRQRYAERTMLSREAKIAEKIEQLREVRKEAWLAWDRSKENIIKQVKEKVGKELEAVAGKPAKEQIDRIKSVATVQGRLPENAYLATILKTLEDEAELEELYPDPKLRLIGKDGGAIQLQIMRQKAIANRDTRELLCDLTRRLAARNGDTGSAGEHN